MTELHLTGWAQAIARECEQARHSIGISAISMYPPLRRAETEFCALWDAWTEAARRGVAVTFYLPVAQQQHPATLRNRHAANIAHDAGMRTRFVPGPRLLHAKSVVIDLKSVWIGSGNMTSMAAGSNHEFYVHFDCRESALAIARYLDSISTGA